MCHFPMRCLLSLFAVLGLLLSASAHAVDDASLAIAAAQYLQLIRDGRDPAGQPAAALTQQAEQQARQKNWTAAIASQETAIVADADQTASWLNLSQWWQSKAEANQDSEVRQRDQDRARQSVWNAYQAARIPFERARALFRLGEFYDRAKEPKQAIAAFREGLELEDNPRIAKRYQDLADANAFQIKGVKVESDSATPKFCLTFSDDLAKDRNIHFEDYLMIQPTIQPVVSATEQRLCVEGVRHGQSYSITARVGIPSATGDKTRVSQDFTAKIEDRKPRWDSRARVMYCRKPAVNTCR
jgi:tetratricopeptide (TPR) repeat protein